MIDIAKLKELAEKKLDSAAIKAWTSDDEAYDISVTPQTILALCEEIKSLRECKREALVFVESHSRHQECDDCWYSCPASGECCNEDAGTECNCGADKAQAFLAKYKERE